MPEEVFEEMFMGFLKKKIFGEISGGSLKGNSEWNSRGNTKAMHGRCSRELSKEIQGIVSEWNSWRFF